MVQYALILSSTLRWYGTVNLTKYWYGVRTFLTPKKWYGM